MFLQRVSPAFAGVTYGFPEPAYCPDCRRMHRLAWRNERHLYKRVCSGSGKPIVSSIAPDSPFTVFDREYWFTDAWNPLDYAVDFDFSKSFAENFRELQKRVPRFSVQQPERMENSTYCNFASNCKDCYFLFDSDFCRDCYFSDSVNTCEDCCDCGFSTDCQLCYEAINCRNCYNVHYSRNCQNCSDSQFLDNCIGCQNCLFCVNLRNKEYYVRNESVAPKDFERTKAKLGLERYSRVLDEKSRFASYLKKFPRRYYQGTNNENVTGDYISNSKNIFESYDIIEGWDLAYCDFIHRSQNCMDVSSFGERIDWMYECATAGLGAHSCAFCFTVIVNCADVYYSDSVYSSKNCFGCVGLHRQENCIFNRKYDRKEYERQVARIVQHMIETDEWGRFFPLSLSPFAYNETAAMDYYPLSREEIEALKAKWKELPQPYGADSPSMLPECIAELPEDAVRKTFSCTRCSRKYRLISAEISFYEKAKLPPPHLCPYCRHEERVKARAPRLLSDRQCGRCGSAIRTTCSRQPAIELLCESCYQQAVTE